MCRDVTEVGPVELKPETTRNCEEDAGLTGLARSTRSKQEGVCRSLNCASLMFTLEYWMVSKETHRVSIFGLQHKHISRIKLFYHMYMKVFGNLINIFQE